MRLAVINRECGECAVCCTTCGVADLHKPTMVRCSHLMERGCGIYEDRPGNCREYNCAWLRGLLPERFRPDRSGVVLSVIDEGANPIVYHAYLMGGETPLDQVEYLFSKLEKRGDRRYVLHVFPPDFVSEVGTPYHVKSVKEGVFLAVKKVGNGRE